MLKVAFDFDETLFDSITELPIKPLTFMMKEMKRLGYEIYIITARHPISHSNILNLLKKHRLNHLVDSKNIYYSSGKSKVPLLRDLDIDIFFDDATHNMVDIINNKHQLSRHFILYQVVHKDGQYHIVDTQMKFVYF